MSDQAAQPQSDTTAADNRKANIWAWAIGLGILLIIGLCAMKVGGSGSEPTAEDVRSDAKRVCQDKFIPARLKAPASAEFSSASVSFDGTGYTVAGAVDSQNSFGAQIRSQFSCTVHQSADRWVLDSANVAG